MVAKMATRGEEDQRVRGWKINKLEFWQKKKQLCEFFFHCFNSKSGGKKTETTTKQKRIIHFKRTEEENKTQQEKHKQVGNGYFEDLALVKILSDHQRRYENSAPLWNAPDWFQNHQGSNCEGQM